MIQQRYAALLKVFRYGLHDGSNMIRTQVDKATLKEIAAKFFLWGDALELQKAHLQLEHFAYLKRQIERNLLTVADLIVHSKNPEGSTLKITQWPLIILLTVMAGSLPARPHEFGSERAVVGCVQFTNRDFFNRKPFDTSPLNRRLFNRKPANSRDRVSLQACYLLQ